MKQFKWIIILAVTAVLLVGGFIAVDLIMKDKEEKAKIGGPKTLFSFDGNTTTRITIENEDGFFRFDWDETDATWKLVSDDPFAINIYAISTVCNYFCMLNTEKTVAFDCKDTSVFGFDHPVTLKVYTTQTGEDHPYILYVGDSTPTYDAYYAMVEGSNDVYTIDYNSGSVFCLAKDTLKNIYMFDTFSTQVTYLKLERDNQTVMELQRDEESLWQMHQPRSFPVNSSEISTMIDTLVRAEYASFVEENPKDFAKYGLDKPKQKLWLKGYFRSSEMSEEFWFGDPISDNADETKLYGYAVGAKQVFTIYRADVFYIFKDAKDYILPYVVSYNISDVDKITIDLGDLYDLHSTLDVNYAEGKATYQLDDKAPSTDSEDLQMLYNNFYRSVMGVQFYELELDAVPPETDPAASFTFDMTDGTRHVLNYISKEENVFYAVLDGNYTGMTIRLNQFTGGTGIRMVYDTLAAALK